MDKASMDLLPRFQKNLQRWCLLEAGEPVVVGVSGGPDSVALLDLLRRSGMCLHVAHLHHGSRGDDADADADFVIGLATRWGLPYTVVRADVPALARRKGLAFEEAARRVRYGFLLETALQLGAAFVAVGHHADDQAETVLMHLLRGAGLSGLRGMALVTPFAVLAPLLMLTNGSPVPLDAPVQLIRPLLEVPRDEIEAHCRSQGLATRFDRSNLDTTNFRNRLRHETLPYLATLNPRITERLCHLAEIAQADYAVLEELEEEAWASLVQESPPDAVIFALAGWQKQPLALQRMLLRRAAFHVRRTLRDVSFVHVDNALAVAQKGNTGAVATLPRGLLMTVGYETLTVSAQDTSPLPESRPWLPPGAVMPVDLPGKTALPAGWQLSGTHVSHWDPTAIAANDDPLVAWVDAAAVSSGVRLRTRIRGDRFCPQGMGGATARLSDFLINARIPRQWRDSLPLLVAGESVLWVVGVRLSELALVRPGTIAVLRLELRRPPSAAGLEDG